MAAPPIVDQTINEMLENHPEPFLWLIFPNKKFKVISTKLDKELTIKTRRTEGMQGMLVEVLNGRFGDLPGKLVRAIQSIDDARQLKTLGRKAMRAESLAEVQALILGVARNVNGRKKPSRT